MVGPGKESPGSGKNAPGSEKDSPGPGERSHTILSELGHAADRHPMVRRAERMPPDQHTHVRAELDPSILGEDLEEATLVVRWYAAPDSPEFSFYYSDSSGFECGWFREPNPHIQGLTGYAERPSGNEEFQHEPVSFASEHPVGLLWEVLDRLEGRPDGS